MHTEQEAREKWCVRSQGDEDVRPEKCIASMCMAWRWGMERKPVPPDGSQAEQRTENVKSERGYCGLAGGSNG